MPRDIVERDVCKMFVDMYRKEIEKNLAYCGKRGVYKKSVSRLLKWNGTQFARVDEDSKTDLERVLREIGDLWMVNPYKSLYLSDGLWLHDVLGYRGVMYSIGENW